MKEAQYYKSEEEGRVKCLLCPQGCLIKPGQVGICRVRENQGGTLYTKVYSKVTSAAYDPIEKKPLYHFYPGRNIFSIGTNGCNLHCRFCQNWQISQVDAPTETMEPERAVELAVRHGSIGIAYTYAEPFIWFEYVLETARLSRQKGLKNVLVTNGLVNREPLLELLPYIDAMNIDLKSIRPGFYRKICCGPQEPALETIKLSHTRCHVELTNLIIPTLNDQEEDLRELVDFVASLRDDIPLHFSRYYPCYKFTIPPTTPAILLKAREIGRQKLKYVYIGNLAGADYNSTFCPGCRQAVIVRDGYRLLSQKVHQGRCQLCGEPISIIGS